MLHGREHELAAIDRLLEAARAGSGGGLVVRGTAGIGKTALLDAAAKHASGMRVLRAVGVEGESALGYATLQELLRPLLDGSWMERLPDPQADALRVAFGRQAGEVPDRFLVSLAALTLLSETATRWPALCLVDDAHWADAPSLAALGFVARRLATEPIALILAARDDPTLDGDAVGMAELRLGGLSPEAAAALLEERWGDALEAEVRRRLLAACGGDPLALIELPATLSSAQRAGREALDDPLPLTSGLNSVFARRIRHLDDQTRTLLLLAAAEGSGRLSVLRRAAHWLGLDASRLESGALTGAVTIHDATVRFTHPLLRSAVYHSADGASRRAMHQALAAVLGEDEADRRAWHRAHATDGPDEGAAADLEASAHRAVRRSGHATAATALSKAAELSPAAEDCARRLTAAAGAAWRAGTSARARGLLDRAEQLHPRAPGVRLDIAYWRGVIEVRTGSLTAGAHILIDGAVEAAEQDRFRAMRLLLAAADAAYLAGQWDALAGIGKAARELAADMGGAGDLAVPVLRLLAAAATWGVGQGGEDQPAAGAGGGRFAEIERFEDPALLNFAGELAWGIGDDELAYLLFGRAAERARARGAAGTLAWVLENLCNEELKRGRLAVAEAHALQGRQLALEVGHPNGANRHQALLARLAALRGHDEHARSLAQEVLAEAIGRQLIRNAATARHVFGLVELGAGNHAEALRHLEALWVPDPLPAHLEEAVKATPELVEAAVGAGEPERARRPLEGFLAWAATSGSQAVWPALAARCLALVATDPQEAERQFTQALALHAQAAHRPIEHARTELAYGEFLRRQRRRTQARAHLRNALDVFGRLGLVAWTERAGRELRATGVTARRRDPGSLDQLTPQELQIVAAVAEGASNREVAARLFITPHTVAYHLHKLFAKLGVSSRAELIRLAHHHGLLGHDHDGDQAG